MPTQIGPYGKGDIDNNGDIDNEDLKLLAGHVAGKFNLEDEQLERADINDNGIINIQDLMLLTNYLKNN